MAPMATAVFEEDYVPGAPPPAKHRRKGASLVRNIVNHFQRKGWKEISSYQIVDFIRHHKLDSNWNFAKGAQDDLGPIRTISDVCGKWGLQLIELRKERGHGTWWEIPQPNGVDDTWCKERNIELD